MVALIRGAGGLPGRSATSSTCRTIRAGVPPRIASQERSAGAGAAGCRIGPTSCGWSRPTPSCPTRPPTAERLRAHPARGERRPTRRRESPASAAPSTSPASLPGESETQIFLQTADQRPISLTVLRRPGEQPRWSVALCRDRRRGRGAAARPTPCSGTGSPARCRRACPPQALSEATPDEAQAIQADYRRDHGRARPLRADPRAARAQKDASSTPTPAQSG